MLKANPFVPDMCVYHGGCMNGFTAAFLVWQQFPDITFVPAYHGKLPDIDPSGRNIIMVDFAPKLADMAFWRRAKQLVIIDHHKSAEEDLKDVPRFLLNEVPMNEPISAFFNMDYSGAGLTWLYFHDVGVPMPLFVNLVQDRDLWRFHYPESKPFSVALSVEPKEFGRYNVLFDIPEVLTDRGLTMQTYHDFVYKEMAKEATMTAFITGATKEEWYAVPTVNAPCQYASDLANHLLSLYPDAPFAACWCFNGRGQFQYSLRSENSRVDVSQIARLFGGGGHRNAAGFEIKDDYTAFTPSVVTAPRAKKIG